MPDLCRHERGMASWRRLFLRILVTSPFVLGAALAQPVITSGPNYCCFTIGPIQQALIATGGSGPYTWSLAGGSLPPGMSIRTDLPASFPAAASAGLIGVATTPGAYSFTLKVTSGSQLATQTASMHISGLLLKDPYQFPDAFANVTFTPHQLTPLNNAGPVSFALNSGALPPGMSMSASGLISGTPTTPGNYNWGVRFTDGVDTQYGGFYLPIYAISIRTPGQLPNAVQNGAYNVTLSASGGSGNYTFTSGGLPNGLTLTPSGVISGTVTAGPGRWTFSLTATDGAGNSYRKLMALAILGGPQFPAIGFYGSGIWDDCTVGWNCGWNGHASDGVPPYSWSATGLPPGISIRYGSGLTANYTAPGDFEFWGCPTTIGTYNVHLTVTDAAGVATTTVLPLNVSPLYSDYYAQLVNGAVGVPYTQKMRVLGGSGAYTAKVVGGVLADGLSLNPATLTVSGTPVETGNLSAAFQFTDGASNSLRVTNYYTIAGGGPGTISVGTSPNLGTWTVGATFAQQLYACCAAGYTWSAEGGSLPPGLTLSPAGALSGTFASAGSYAFLARATDSHDPSNTGARQFVINVTPIAVTAAPVLPYGNVGVAYAQALRGSGAVGVLSWALVPYSPLPPGLTLSADGTISGTPTQTGQFPFTVQGSDSVGNSGAWTFAIFIFPAAAIRYVGPSGSDANPGSLSQPYLTIQKCAGALFGGSTCLIRGGAYHEAVTPNSGVAIKPYNNETVTVDGTDPVAGWTVYQGAIYQASVSLRDDDTNQLFVGSQMMTEARWPNGDDLFRVNWATAGAGTNDTQLLDANLPNVDWTGAKVHLVSGDDPWSPQSATVTASAAGRLTIALDDVDYSPYIRPQAAGRYYLYRSLAGLDKEGEWWYDSRAKTLYFRAPGDVDPNTLTVRVKRRLAGFELSGRSDVTIQNINLFACNINMNANSANNTVDGVNVQYASHFTDMPGSGPANPTSYWYVHTLDSGIVLAGSGSTLRNSTVSWSAGSGVSMSGTNHVVSNNLIVDTGYAGNYASGISLFGTGHKLDHNTIHTNGRFSLTINSSYPDASGRNDIGYNNFFNSTLLSLDAGEIYVGGPEIKGARIHHNWLHDTQTPIPFNGNLPRPGMYLDEDASGFEVDQNVLWNNQYYNIFLHGSTSGATAPFNNFIHNNSIPDAALNGHIWVQDVVNCGTTLIQENAILAPVTQTGTTPNCGAVNNNAAAPGATEMGAGVAVGCSFAGCASSGPPAVSGTSVAPSIALQPVPAAVAPGQRATFSVTAAGAPDPTYQWQRNGIAIPGASAATHTTTPASYADNGARFSVRVSNALGAVTSDAAPLAVGGSVVLAPVISSVVNAESGSATISPNTWVAISGVTLAPVGDTRVWQGTDFASGQMPSQLDGVSVDMNGTPAYVFYISPRQVNVLTPPDLAPGPLEVTVTSGGFTSAPFGAQAAVTSPSFFIMGAGPYVLATHADGRLVGPATLYPGLTTPAAPGESIILYGNGFGPVTTPVTAGSGVQTGSLPTAPVMQIGGLGASVSFAGLISPGLYQFNVVAPPNAPAGDNTLTAQYNGVKAQSGILLTIQK